MEPIRGFKASEEQVHRLTISAARLFGAHRRLLWRIATRQSGSARPQGSPACTPALAEWRELSPVPLIPPLLLLPPSSMSSELPSFRPPLASVSQFPAVEAPARPSISSTCVTLLAVAAASTAAFGSNATPGVGTAKKLRGVAAALRLRPERLELAIAW